MYFFFNKDKNSGKPQNIFGEGIKNYFYDCVKEWFNVEDKDLTFDAKLKYIQSSVVDEIQFLEMDQIEKSGIRIIESPDKEREEKEFKQISALIISNNIKDKKESQNEVNVDQNSNSETIRLHREEFFKRNNNHSETNTIEKIKDNYNVEKNDHISENNSSNFNIQKEINNQQDETNKPKNLTETKSEDRNNPEEKEKNDSKNKYINTTGQPKNINVMKNNNNISTNGGSINRQPDVDESMKTEKEKEKDNSKNKKIDKQNYVRSYKIKFWISMMSMFLFCGAIYFSIYFVVFVFINLAFSTFYFKKQKDHKQQISKKFDITNDSVDYKVKTNEDKNQDFIPSMIKDSIDLENKVNG